MDKKAAQQLIENTFNEAFDEDQFTIFAKNLLNDLEPKSNFYTGNLIWDDYKEHINTYKRIGKYTDPEGEPLDVLIVEVKSIQKLERARTALRNFVIKHLSKFEKDYALVAFYSKEDKGLDWRFSFIKLEYRSELDAEQGKVKTTKEFTPAKRYSFLVGKYEKSHTAKNQLLPLLQNIANNPTIEELEAAFSIEKVTDEFFEQYKSLFEKLSKHIAENDNIQTELVKSNIDTTRFTKKLLGQIVFLYFLQKKGWLGVAQNAKWGTGKKRFIQELFDQAQSEGVNFFKDKLQYLFYEGLAKERDNENSFYTKLNCRIPFLNGGLFEADYDWENANITIPTSLFRSGEEREEKRTGVLDILDRYNFTIKEDEPLDKEVAVDPEMLGKVFENMLDITERKSKGAFYTPREIVHYMCQESLIHYLDNSLNNGTDSYQAIDSDQTSMFAGNSHKKGNLKIELEHKGKILVPKSDIEIYIREGHFALENDQRVASKGETKTYQYQLPESIRQNADLIDKKLSDIRICDPAIGSGAFPVGLLHELVNAMLVLKPHFSLNYLKDKLDKFGFKERESVNESRYIYRLKRHIIQESIYGVDIDPSAIDIARLRLWLSLVVDEDDLDPIETLPNLDYKIVCGNSLIGLPAQGVDRYPQLSKELEELKEKFYNETNEQEKKKLRTNINEKILTVLKAAEDFEGYKIDFDFKLYFSEVWREKGGFDVVIGNPPYIQISKLDLELKKNLAKMNFETFSSSGDIYELFYENGNRVLAKGGHLCFITSNKWLRANYGTSTRKFFLTNTNPKLLFDFGQEMVFTTAIVHSNILLFQKEKFKNEFKGCQLTKAKLNSLIKYFNENSIRLDYFNEEVWAISTPELIKVKLHLEKIGTKISDWNIDINYGLKTGYNDAFIIDEDKKNELESKDKKNKELIKPILRGRDTRKYYCNFHNYYLINTHNGSKKQRISRIDVVKEYPTLYEHLKYFLPKVSIRSDRGDHWTNLRNCAYLDELEKNKIVFSEIVSEPQFYYDTQKYYPEATAFLITGENLKWLTAFLNSELITVLFRIFYAGGELVGKYRYKKAFLENLPIPEPNAVFKPGMELLVDYLGLYKGVYKDKSKEKSESAFFESIVDCLVYEIVFPEEIKSAGKEILKHLRDLKPISNEMSEEEKLAIVESEFERLYDPNHPVRFAIETLDSVEEVRIIKEVLK
ncbi:Eco57I restriction-modification methylase domain-containing protein [Algoriphagus lutimaris]|uniref:Eco57I restriction-modification methylase domain-containing protein n=1 Tax=Algoriphagus lutimaris TaxID=613197 RepID=UPI00196A2A2E|nr:Eco57I restriction-modification methylase domain-containing protein [Algoriphagus lutimaris]MBN3520714.1 Eco57I restriction-modification methylase domain-containing protein [Algoriphagus lutimaris]